MLFPWPLIRQVSFSLWWYLWSYLWFAWNQSHSTLLPTECQAAFENQLHFFSALLQFVNFGCPARVSPLGHCLIIDVNKASTGHRVTTDHWWGYLIRVSVPACVVSCLQSHLYQSTWPRQTVRSGSSSKAHCPSHCSYSAGDSTLCHRSKCWTSTPAYNECLWAGTFNSYPLGRRHCQVHFLETCSQQFSWQ